MLSNKYTYLKEPKFNYIDLYYSIKGKNIKLSDSGKLYFSEVMGDK